MGSLIIRAGRLGENTGTLFQVSGGIEAGLLGRMIARTMNWDRTPAGHTIKYQIEAQQLGRMLSDGEILTQAGILDNYLLVFHCTDAAYQPVASPQAAERSTATLDGLEAGKSPDAAPDGVSPAQAASRPEVQADPVTPPDQSAAASNTSYAPVDPVVTADAQNLPLAGWRPLDVEVPPAAAEVKDQEESDQSGFVWRQLD